MAYTWARTPYLEAFWKTLETLHGPFEANTSKQFIVFIVNKELGGYNSLLISLLSVKVLVLRMMVFSKAKNVGGLSIENVANSI